jgi:hypothetical protein
MSGLVVLKTSSSPFDPKLTSARRKQLHSTQSCCTRFHDLSRHLHHGSACERQVSLTRHSQRNVARTDRINQLRRSLTSVLRRGGDGIRPQQGAVTTSGTVEAAVERTFSWRTCSAEGCPSRHTNSRRRRCNTPISLHRPHASAILATAKVRLSVTSAARLPRDDEKGDQV